MFYSQNCLIIGLADLDKDTNELKMVLVRSADGSRPPVPGRMRGRDAVGHFN